MKVMVSGGFDPLHVGHLDLLEGAAELGAVVVALNSDNWLLRKKGYLVMPYEDRARILRALGAVTAVVPVADVDGTVCAALEKFRPHIFANGGDRKEADPREAAACMAFGINQMFDVGGGKTRSSSNILAKSVEAFGKLHHAGYFRGSQ